MANWVGLCDLGGFPSEGMHAFEVGAKRLAVYLIDGKVYATDNVCSHAFALLTDGWLDDGLVECPLHGAQFDVKTGAVIRGPAECPVAVFEMRIRDGLIEVLIDSES
ncbi:non-heme iron oxygenase ferredoxin subunit [Bradyrhizobium sp. 169]|nr:non-heme iron oxygenase ferredoxin subunit [Bradyrhizobium sp. 169]MCK1592105.1 non-heme iron oxygenase ferredoxin subunit [Bradyrhizobium sp. 169]